MNEEVNFNQVPKRGNIGLIIGVIIIILIFVAVGNYILGNVNENNNNEYKENLGSNLEGESDFDFDDESINNAKEPLYESGSLTAIDRFGDKTIDYEIVDVVNNGKFTYLVTSDKKILEYNIYGYECILTGDNNFKKICQNTFDTNIVVENKDNSYSIYDGVNLENNFTINANGLVAAYLNFGKLSVFTLEDGILYYTWYKKVDGKVETDKGPVIIEENCARGQKEGSSPYTGKIKYAKPTEKYIAIMREDGTVYYLDLNIYYDFVPEDGYKFDTNSIYKIIDNVDQILADTTIANYIKPFYSLKTDNKNIYVRKMDYSSISSTVSIKVPLPDNYKVADIKELYAIKEILLITDDGNVFYKEKAAQDVQWEKIEELTELNKKSHIVKIVDTYMEFLILCDDGYLYRYIK